MPPQPVPSPDKGGGLVGQASNLPTVKPTYAHRTANEASDYGRISGTNDTARKRKKRLWKRNTLRLGTWNITSWTNKDQEVVMELVRHNIDICALSETRKKGKGNIQYQHHILFYSGKAKDQRAHAGVGIMIHKRLENHVEEVDYVNENLMHLKFKFGNTRLHVISVYLPDMSKPNETREEAFEMLQEKLDNLPKEEKVFVMGDFNSRVGNVVLPGIMHSYNEEEINNNGERLITLCAQNELRINNTYFNPNMKYSYTFMNTRGQKSVIDYVITNRNIHPTQILDTKTLNSANVGTDHALLLCKYRLTENLIKKKKPNYITKFNVESFRNESTRLLYQNRLSEKLRSNPITLQDNVSKAWEKIKENLLNSATEAIGIRRININGKKNEKPWFTEEVKALALEKKQAYIKYKNNQNQEEYTRYKSIRNRTNNAIKQLKQSYWESFSMEMEHDLYGGQKKVWNVLRNRKRPVNEEVQINSISPETWVSHFKNLYNCQNVEEEPERELLQNENLEEGCFNQEDVHNTLKKLKNRKAPGIDQITNEMLKYGGHRLESELTTLFLRIVEDREIPDEWRTSITIPIFKKGQKKDPNNYRGITLLSSVLKLLTKIISIKVTEQVGVREEQQGFRQNRSTLDAIFILRQLVEKSLEYNKPLFLCFVDLKQAFDRIKLKDVLRVLQNNNVNRKYIELIKELNTESKTRIKVANRLTEEVHIVSGIRQGDSLSPALFNFIMNEVIDRVREVGAGFEMGDNVCKILCYADDTILTAESEDDLQRLLHKFSTAAESFSMEISGEKTKSMVISKEPVRCKLAVYNKSIEQVMNFNYLGVETSSNRNMTNEVRSQTNKAARISGSLRDIIWRNKYMSVDSKVRIYKTCVRPIITYAAETRAETSKTKNLMRTTEMKILRTIKGVSLRDGLRSRNIRQDCGIQDIVRHVRARRRQWRDHVDRMEQHRIAKWARAAIPFARRLPGRPPKRWQECWTSTSQEA